MNDRERFVFNDLMDAYQFEVIHNDDGTLSVYDLQHACLGDICDEIFKDEFEILERMEMYHEDYIIRLLEEDFNIYFDTYGEWLQFLKEQNNDEYAYDIAILSLIVNKRLDI
jgi:cobalamin biosynthesis Co2+ chelatase CbiK